MEDTMSPSMMQRRRGLGALISHQEIFLRILAFLDTPESLAAIQGVNRYWAHMAVDPQLWKRLYLSRYPHPHHSKLVYKSPPSPRGRVAATPQTSTSSPTPLRPIARLPSRAFPPPSPSRSPSSSSLRKAGEASSSTASPHGRSAGTGHAIPLSRREPRDASSSQTEEVGSGIRNDGVDWKMMLRLGTNWSKGNASSQTTITLPPSPSPSISSLDLPHRSDPPPPSFSATGTEQHIALSPSFIFTSNPTSPLVHVYASSSSPSVRLGIIPPPPGWSSPSRPDNITAIASNQSVSDDEVIPEGESKQKRVFPARLAVFYQSGGIVIFSIRSSGTRGSIQMTWNRESILPPTTRPRRRTTSYAPRKGDPVVLAVYHHPVLITCTQGFHLSVYSLPSSLGSTPSQPEHLSTLHSDVSYHPAALSLFPSDGISTFRASLTYCTPVYPSSWTVAAQEFDISLKAGMGEVNRAEYYHVDTGSTGDEEEIMWPRRIKPVIGVKGRRATGIGTDGRWCILSGGDNQIQVYALPSTDSTLHLSTPSTSRIGEKKGDGVINHSQTLLAHSARVTSVSLSAGRCVSGGNDGRILVWDLDEEDNQDPEGRIGRTVGYVEVRTDEERVWRGAAGPRPSPFSNHEAKREDEGEKVEFPHPQAISSAARSFFLPRPPIEVELELEDKVREVRPGIKQLVFDEEKIVGLVSGAKGQGGGDKGEVGGEVMKVWSFG